MAVETLVISPEFERKPNRETERTYLPVFPEVLEQEYRERATPVEQFYLSHPDEEFSLRLREDFDEKGMACYTATLKDRGQLHENGLKRLEIEAEITPELYDYYRSPDCPMIRKLRAYANRHVSIDFFEDGSVHAEAEDPIAWTAFADTAHTDFVDVTGDKQVRSEWKAHLAFRRERGYEALQPQADLSVSTIVQDILATRCPENVHFVQIGGRSGSGKSTIVRNLRKQLSEYGLSSEVISTDDYHRGEKWLSEYSGGEQWCDWDDPIVYDTEHMADDLARLASGERIAKREVDFTGIVESKIVGEIRPVDVLIIEGIYAGSPDLALFADNKYEMPTPLATCIGRRLRRDLLERPEFADATKSLRYMLEYAEPRYRAQ